MPSLYEYVGSPYGNEYESSSTTDAEITQKPPRKEPVGDDWMDPAEFRSLIEEIINTTEDAQEASVKLKEIFEENLYMHEELGEIEGKDYYADEIQLFIDHYKDQF